jgi:hypothetical protein
MFLDMPKYMSTVVALVMYNGMSDVMSKIFDFDMSFDMSLGTVCFTGIILIVMCTTKNL